MFQNLSDRRPFAATDHEYATRIGVCDQGGINETLMIDVFIIFRRLNQTIDGQHFPVLVALEDSDLLELGSSRKDNLLNGKLMGLVPRPNVVEPHRGAAFLHGVTPLFEDYEFTADRSLGLLCTILGPFNPRCISTIKGLADWNCLIRNLAASTP